jgi:TonB family protein
MSTAPVSRSLSRITLDDAPVPVDTQSVRTTGQAQPQAQLLVLSTNAELLDVVRNAGHSIADVVHAENLNDADRTLPGIEPGVLVVDASIAADVGDWSTALGHRFPEAVVVIVGTREQSSELMQLTAAGKVFRFLLMPLSYGPVRLALAAAVSQHFERKAISRRLDVSVAEGAPGRKFAWTYLGLAAGLLVVVAGLWGASNLLVARQPVPIAPAAPAVMSANLDPALTLVARAAEAMAQGRYLEPSGDSALDLYRSALRLDPNNEAAKAGIRAVADEFLRQAEEGLLAEKLEDADSAMAQVRTIDPGHPRLTFLETQLKHERERLDLSQQRDVSTRVRKLVSDARTDMQAGNLMGPSAGGAMGALLRARRLAADDPAVVQGIRDLNSALADAVRVAMSTGDAQRAESLANAARRLGGDARLLTDVERTMTESSQRGAAQITKVALVTPPVPAPVTPPGNNDPGVSERSPLTSASMLPKVEVPPGTASPGAIAVLQADEIPRTRQVMPVYPVQATEFGMEGYVDLDFTISPEGVPKDVKVRGAVPKRVFDNAAITAVRQWRWQPILQNGTPVARNATLRMRFQLKSTRPMAR